MPRLVVVPTDPLAAYESKGIGSRLARYYNPLGLFDEVVCLSPFEWGRRHAFGMRIEPCTIDNFRRKVLEISPSVIRVYGGGTACDIAMSASGCGIPIIVSIHDLHPQLMQTTLAKADYVLAVSEAVRKALLYMGVAHERIRLLPNRIDLERFSPASAPAAGGADNGYEILHLGRKSPQKNLDNIIRALAMLPPSYRLTAAGPGDATEYRQLADTLGVGDRVRFPGSIPNLELPDALRRAACLCNPSRWEGFGVVFLEALACGTPVVARDCAPATELIVDGVSGILVRNIEEPAQIASAIRQACENEQLRARFHATGPQIASRYSLARQSAAEVEIYQQIVSEHERSKTS